VADNLQRSTNFMSLGCSLSVFIIELGVRTINGEFGLATSTPNDLKITADEIICLKYIRLEQRLIVSSHVKSREVNLRGMVTGIVSGDHYIAKSDFKSLTFLLHKHNRALLRYSCRHSSSAFCPIISNTATSELKTFPNQFLSSTASKESTPYA
jgi:hypothetical protein